MTDVPDNQQLAFYEFICQIPEWDAHFIRENSVSENTLEHFQVSWLNRSQIAEDTSRFSQLAGKSMATTYNIFLDQYTPRGNLTDEEMEKIQEISI